MAYDPRYVEDNRRDDGRGMGNAIGVLGGVAAAVGIGIAMPNTARTLAGGIGRATEYAGSNAGRAVSYLARRYGTQVKQTGSFIKAMDYAMEGRSPFSMIFGMNQRMEQRFARSYENSMNTINRRAQTPLGGLATRMEQGLFDLDKTLTNVAPRMHFKAVQFASVMSRLKQQLPRKFHEGLDTILGQQEDTFFSKPSVASIEDLINKYTKEQIAKTGKQFSLNFENVEERQNFVDTMFGTLKHYQSRRADGFADKKALFKGSDSWDFGMKVQGLHDLKRSLRSDFIEQNRVDNESLFNKLMARFGMRQATNRDMLKRNAEGKWENHLFDADNISGQRRDVGRRIARYANFAERRGMGDEFLDLAADSRLFIDKNGKLVDMRSASNGIYNSMSFLREQFQVPFLRFNPLDLMHWSTFQSIREAPSTYFFRRGTIHPFLGKSAQTTAHPMAHNQDAAVGPLNKEYMFSNGKIYDVMSGEVIKDNMFLASARFGVIPRMTAGMANLHRQNLAGRGFFSTLFDFGQETQSVWQRGASVITKFGDEDWELNAFRLMFNGNKAYGNPMVPGSIEEAKAFREKTFKNIYAYVNQYAPKMSDETVDFLNQRAIQAYGRHNIDLSRLDDDTEVISALEKIAKGLNDPNSGIVRVGDDYNSNGLNNLITNTWNSYKSNPSEFMRNKRLASEQSPFVVGAWQATDPYETTLVGKLDDVRRLIHQHAIEQIQQTQRVSVGQLITDGIQNGTIGSQSMDEIRGMNVLSRLQNYWDPVYRRGGADKEEAIHRFFQDVTGSLNDNEGAGLANSLYNEIRHHSNMLSPGPGDKPPQYFGLVGHTAMEKGRGYKWALNDYNERVKAGEGEITAGLKSAWGVLGQPFAGRHNMEGVTAATIPFYYFAERLDNALGKIGLGLSQKSRGSMQSILWNQFGRRIVLPYMAVQQLNYFDDQFGNMPSEALADTYVNMHIGMAGVKDMLGLNTIGNYFGDLFQGTDQIGKIPVFAGLKHASFGFFGDNRSAEEVKEYYESGEDPIRKGRWWGVGSNTPWEGGKIDRFEPNWYRKLKSHYKYTDTLYGSSDEYWANHWMPTLTNPLAPLRHFITDANHWEEKHRDDRPYPVQGGIAELQMIPVVGPTLDNTLGRLVKPRVVRGDLEKQHEAYIEEVNEYIRSQYYANTQEGTLNVMPAGGYQLMSGVGGTGGFGDAGLGFGGSGGGFGSGYGLNVGEIAVDGTVIGGGGTYTNVKDVSKGQLAAINMGLMGGQSNARSFTSLESLRDPDLTADLSDIANPFGVKQSLSGAQYTVTELAGIYGFGFRMFTGQSQEDPGMALEQSGKISSYARAWWDLEMGGLGGDLSEIGRRYLPRDPRKTTYNPIKNTMPDWMPGVDYFIDFQHGDPYSKVAKGEIRLPGSAYESINNLHPDQFGEYGAFDRFKILADVAPYSNQYKFWRRQVAQMNANNQLDPSMKAEYAEIRDQVSAKKDKYHFYPYKFKYADINKEQVTVTKVLDAETFLTAEHPNNPIKLAGVQIPSDAVKTQEWLYQQIYEGAKLTIGVDADPLFRIRDDSMNTIRAVVYSNGEKDLPFYMDQKGQSLNQIVTQRDFGDENKAKRAKDTSAVGTAAFYDSAEITVGKIWENTIHNIGKVPVFGTIFDKFVQVKSPLELYKKNELYGKAWRPWYEPWSGWIQPMIQTAAEQNPLLAAAQGYGVGWLFGRGQIGKRWGTFIGASVMGGAAALRSLDEAFGRVLPNDGEEYTWIPKRRQKEREINEYFDILKYMKFKGLYEKTRVLALEKEGVDLEKVLGDSQRRGERNKQEREYLETMKKWLSIQEKTGYIDDDIIQEKLSQARSRLGQIDGDRGSYALGKYSMQAMQYRAEYESTLYGADPDGDLTKIFRAMPSKEREFFQHFMTAAPEEREEILRLVPKDQRRFYQAKWGMKVDDKQSLGSYFMSHNLPGAGWEGWRPDVSLDSIKLKVIENEGLELTEFGMWDDDIQRARQEGTPEINPFRPSMSIDPFRIEKVLRGAGLSDVSVTVQVAPSRGENKLNVAMDVLKDRSQDIITAINSDLGALI